MESNLYMSGSLSAKKIKAARPSLFWKLSNILRPSYIKSWLGVFVARPIAKFFGLMTAYGELSAVLVKSNGEKINYGVLSRRVVTTAFVNALATYMFDGSGPAPTAYDYHDSGVGTTAEATSDTDIQTTDGESRVAGTPTNPSSGQYRSVGTISYTTTKAITEHGLFSASTSGTLLDRSVFSAINVVNGDSIQFTYTLTITAGG